MDYASNSNYREASPLLDAVVLNEDQMNRMRNGDGIRIESFVQVKGEDFFIVAAFPKANAEAFADAIEMDDNGKEWIHLEDLRELGMASSNDVIHEESGDLYNGVEVDVLLTVTEDAGTEYLNVSNIFEVMTPDKENAETLGDAIHQPEEVPEA